MIWNGAAFALHQALGCCAWPFAPLMAWRVIPFFVMRAVTGLQIPMHTVAVSGN